jgi:hypothetical protein
VGRAVNGRPPIPGREQLRLDLATPKAGRKHRIGQADYVAADCEGKPTYPNATVAFRTLRHRNRHSKARKVLEPYRCPHCGQWHIGGKNG